jgi:hypothetical protein
LREVTMLVVLMEEEDGTLIAHLWNNVGVQGLDGYWVGISRLEWW